MADEKKDVLTIDEAIQGRMQEVLKGISDIDSIIPNESLMKLQEIADPKLRLQILSQIFYIKKISESQSYGDALGKAVKKLAEFLPELPFEKLLLAIQEITKVKQMSDGDINTFLVKGRESDAKMVEAEAKVIEAGGGGLPTGNPVQVNIDNRSVINQPIIQEASKLPPELLDRMLRMSETVVQRLNEKAEEDKKKSG